MFSTTSASPRKAKSQPRAVTLLECVIVMGVMVVMLGATHAFLAGGVSFYQNTVQGLAVQQQALVGLTNMGKELVSTNLDKVVVDQTVKVPVNTVDKDRDVVIFPSVVTSTGNYLSSDTGRPLWPSVICYIQMEPTDTTLLVRRLTSIDPPVDYPVNPLQPPHSLPVLDRTYFENRPSTSIMCRSMEEFTATKTSDAIELDLTVSFSSNRTSDKMQITTKVFPKN